MRVPKADAVPITEMKPLARVGQIILEHFIDLISLNLMTLVFSLPVITLPAAMIACCSVIRRYFCGVVCSLRQDYLVAFRRCFRLSLPLGAVTVVIPALAVYVVPFYRDMASAYGTVFFVLLVAAAAVVGFVLIMGMYLFAQADALALSFPNMLKNAAILAVVKLPRNLLGLLVLTVFAIVFIIGLPHTALVAVGFAFISYGLTAVCVAWPGIEEYVVNDTDSTGAD